MARSRRAKLVSLTNTTKRGREQKENLITEIQEAIERFNNIYLFSVEHMRNTFLKDIRADLPDSRFFFGKNRVMSKAFGVALSDEPHPGLAEIGRRLVGNVGLLLTNRPHDEIVDYFATFSKTDYARAGAIASETIELSAGPVFRGINPVAHPMEPTLRQLGMPTSLVQGVVTLQRDFTICTKGQAITSEQSHLLKLLLVPLSEFRVTLLVHWIKPSAEQEDVDRASTFELLVSEDQMPETLRGLSATPEIASS